MASPAAMTAEEAVSLPAESTGDRYTPVGRLDGG
jgi:hypothetical protein